jgi:hypothetical protein
VMIEPDNAHIGERDRVRDMKAILSAALWPVLQARRLDGESR